MPCKNSLPAETVCLNCSLSLTSTTLSFVEERISFASSLACDKASFTFSGSEASFNKSRKSSNTFSILLLASSIILSLSVFSDSCITSSSSIDSFSKSSINCFSSMSFILLCFNTFFCIFLILKPVFGILYIFAK